MPLHIPTVFVLMIALNAVLAISFAVAATGSQRDLRLWAVALAFNWLGYVALAVHPAGWEWLAILITNLALAIMMSLYIHGVDRIRGHRQARANLVWPVIMVGLLALLVSDDLQHPEASATESAPAVSLAPITHHCSASIGLALSKPGEIDAQALIDRADQAMYRAKEHGRNQVSA